ncbi:MAG: cellulose biosynthesis cyclic di-GMP-binding regulatory protein BcsB [Clostridiales bacterium]|nr:cellulose biosynthesis cyclic di-GMP-binding regulatory protein BcsB [Clostridiales bacterium]
MNGQKRAYLLMVVWMLALCCAFGTMTGVAEGVDAPVPAPQATQEPTPAPDQASASVPRETEEIPLGVNDLLVQQQLENQSKLEQTFQNAQLQGTYYADYSFGGVQFIRGIYSVLSLYAEMPEYAEPTMAMLRVCYTASDLILSDVSSLTFYMNGTPFYSTHVQVGIGQTRTVLYIPVPVELLKSGYNLLEIGAYVRLTDDEGCTDDYNGANWVKFDESTCLRIAYELSERAEELSVFPYPFLSMMDKTGANSAVAVSDAADADELTAALNLMAGFGTALSAQNDMELARISQTTRSHVIYFGLRDNTPNHLLSLLDQEVPQTGALLQLVKDGEREYLLVVSREREALLEAAQMLSDADRVTQLHGRSAHVSVGEARAYIEAGTLSALAVEGQYTFKDMLGHGASFVGPFHQTATIYLPVPEDYALSSEGKFSFHIRYSENLDWDRSLMTVYWGNNLPLYSRQLTREGAYGTTVAFSVPADAVGVAGTYLTITFDLEVKDLDCTPRQLDMPWAYIAEDSVLYLPQGERAGLSLSNRPAPFQRNSRMDNVLVVLPDVPDAEDLNLCGRAVAMLGAGSDPYGKLRAIRADFFNASTDGDWNLILVGKPSSNRMIANLNSSLHFKYSEDLTRYESNEKLILNEAYAREVGVIQLLVSPYSVNRVMLVLSAPESAGIKALTERISSDKLRWALTKEAVLVDAHGQASSYQFTTTRMASSEQKAPTFTRVVMENREPLILLLTGLGSMLIVLIGLLIIALRARRYNRGKKE